MTLYLNAFLKTGELSLFSNSSIIQSSETAELSAYLSRNGNVAGETVYFYEKYEPTLNLTADKSIMQTGDTLDLKAKLKDEDGSLVKGETVYFFKSDDVYEEIAAWNESGYQTPYYDTPIEITGEMKRKSYYGGLRIYGDDNNHHYVYLGQGSATNDENAKIFYKFTDNDNWSSFRITIGNGSISLYVDGTLIQTVSADTSKAVSVWGGSNTNRVSVRNVKISVLK